MTTRDSLDAVVRAPRATELDAIVAVVTADELASTGEVTLGEDFVRGEWTQPGFDPAADAWVAVVGPDRVVGYGQAKLEEPHVVVSWGSVHPDYQGRKLGPALFERIEQRASAMLAGQPSGRLRHAIYAGDTGAATMLSARGLQPARHFWHMQIDLTSPQEPASMPQGIEIGPPSDLRVVYEVIDEALSSNWDYHQQPFEQWLEELTSTPGHDPALWLLAAQAGQPVGALTASVAEDRGWVDYLGVLEPYRGRGIAGALLRRCFSDCAERGLQRVLVSVDAQNASGATGVYERAGMRTVKGWEMWERVVTASA